MTLVRQRRVGPAHRNRENHFGVREDEDRDRDATEAVCVAD
jgi:hypothetical protein